MDEDPTMIVDELVGLAQEAAGREFVASPLVRATGMNDLTAETDRGGAI